MCLYRYLRVLLIYLNTCLLLNIIRPNVICAAEKYQITFQLSPSYEALSPRDARYRGIFGNKFSYNFGFEYKNFYSPGFSLSVGLDYQNKGFRNVIELNTTDTASTGFSDAVIIGAARYLALPLDMNFHYHIAEKTEFIFSTGITVAGLLQQTLNGKRVPEEIPNSTVTALGAENGKKNIDIFNPLFYGFNISAGFCKYIKSKGVIVVQPKYTRGLSKALANSAPVSADYTPKLDSFSIDIRIGYYFTRQIKNAKKDF